MCEGAPSLAFYLLLAQPSQTTPSPPPSPPVFPSTPKGRRLKSSPSPPAATVAAIRATAARRTESASPSRGAIGGRRGLSICWFPQRHWTH
ncbi:Hypothetical predicted protein [Podarcis lilfordi]|uniref:Uncharacterized protein n=1 Tax=Podarcis lilfordi TaxID=74358 RepID=A0AA35KPG7_9SAUR|nr:Hypothetical predicted protein [Podarcis lilfordi]